MTAVFLKLMNMSLTASVLALCVMLFRAVFRKAPKWLTAALWGLVALRLLAPVSIQSSASLLPSAAPVTTVQAGSNQTAPQTPHLQMQTGIRVIDKPLNDILDASSSVPKEAAQTNEDTKTTPAPSLPQVLTVVWACGAGLMLAYALLSTLRLRRKVGASLMLEKGIYLCDEIASPFILGVLRPRIYLPSSLNETQREPVLRHERAHLRRHDHWWKPLGFAVLSVYWFNPVLWVAYVLLCRDIELACDEKVIRDLDLAQRAAYTQTLLDCRRPRAVISACPVAFGEVGVKQRVKAVLSYKKPAFWVIVAALIASAVLAICFLTDPKKTVEVSPELDAAIHTAILQDNEGGKWHGECATEGHVVYGCEQSGDQMKVYLYHGYARYGFINGSFTDVAGHWMCAVLTMEQTEDGYTCKKIDYPRDGSENAASIKRLFPKRLESRALDPTQSDIDEVERQCTLQAEKYLRSIDRSDAQVVRYGDLNLQLPNLTADVSNKLSNTLSGFDGLYEETLGTREQLENGVRYVYRTAFLSDTNSLLFVKEVFGTDEVKELMLFSGETGELLYRDVGRTEPNELHRINARATGSPGARNRLMMPTRENLWTDGVWVNTETFSGQSTKAAEDEYVTIYFNYPVAESHPEQMPYVHAICYMGDVYDGVGAIDPQMDSPANREKWTTQAANVVPTGPGVDPASTATAVQASKLTADDYTKYDASNGLTVYVWKMSENKTRYGLLPGAPESHTIEQTADMPGVRVERMREILQGYHISPEKVYVKPFQIPISSYLWEFDSQEQQRQREALGLTLPTQAITGTSEPFVPPTTTQATEPPGKTYSSTDTSVTRAYTPEEAAAISRFGEEVGQRFPRLIETTNGWLFGAYEHMNTYAKFQDAVVSSSTVEPQSGSTPKTVTLVTDKGTYIAQFDKGGSFLSDNR